MSIKLICKNPNGLYRHPITGHLIENAYVLENQPRRDHLRGRFEVDFYLLWDDLEKGITHEIDRTSRCYFGVEADINLEGATSNKPSILLIPNPDYDSENPETPEFNEVNLIDTLMANAGAMPEGSKVKTWGQPTLEKLLALGWFQGGDPTSNDHRLTLTNPFGRAYLLEQQLFFNEPLGKQFKFEDE